MKKIAMALVVFSFGLIAVSFRAQAPCDVNATPSNFASLFGSTQSGTICLAAGNYGNFNGGAKASMVTVQPAAGGVNFSGSNFGSSVRNVTVRGINYTGPIEISPPSGVKMNLVLDGLTLANVGHGDHEGRVSIVGGGSSAIGGNGVWIKNSMFGPGGCSDGIQDSSNGTEIGPNNTFRSIKQNNCSEHVDSIQPYASNYVWIHGNFFEDDEQGIMSPDGVSQGYRIENNVIQLSTGYPCMHIGDSRNGTISRNVCRNGSIRVYGGNQNVPSQNMTVQNNVASLDASACTGCTISNNASPSQVAFAGGTPGLCAWATKTPTGTGTGGSTIGLDVCGTPPPPGVTVTVAPAAVTKQVGQTQQFTATVTGTTNPAVTWTATCGNVGANGFYTAPGAATSCTVRATSQADASKFGTAAVTVTAGPPPPGCSTSSNQFQNTGFATQTGNFTVEYDATPASQTMDAVTSLSNGPATSYNSNAVSVRFASSRIEARSGNDYLPIPNAGFVAGTTYHFKLVVRISAHTYDAFVNAAGSTVINSLTGLAFRFEQSNVAQLNNWSQRSEQGTQQVCNFTLSTAPAPTLGPINCASLTCTITQTNNPSGTQFPGTFTGPNGQSASATAIVP